MIRRFALLFPLAGALAGCTVGPDYTRPALPETGAAFLRASEADTTAAPISHWWEDLQDPQLSALVEQGIAQAPALAAAEARLRQARSGLTISRAALLPSLSAAGTYVYADLPNDAFGTEPGNNEFYTLGFDAQWEVDLWGGKRRGIERARAETGTAAAMLADTQVSLSAEIARAYIALRAREASQTLLERRRDLETRLAEIAAARAQAGTGTRQMLVAATRKRAHTEAEIAGMAAEISTLRDTLAILTGQTPGTLDGLATAAVPLPPVHVAIGDPTAMLARRPDVMAAERRLAAASADIGAAKARRFPAISLLGLIGIGSTNADDLFDTSQLAALAIPRLTWNFLDFGRGAATVHGAKAARDAALADYRASVLGALQDAEASLARFGAARIAFAQAARSAAQAQEIARLDGMRAHAGTAAPGEALQAEAQAIDARLAEANNRASLTLAYVTLAKSLGLGWQTE